MCCIVLKPIARQKGLCQGHLWPAEKLKVEFYKNEHRPCTGLISGGQDCTGKPGEPKLDLLAKPNVEWSGSNVKNVKF